MQDNVCVLCKLHFSSIDNHRLRALKIFLLKEELVELRAVQLVYNDTAFRMIKR